VLIDNVRTTDTEGKVTETPLNDQQLARITQLVKDAVGFNAERGDSVNVVNSSFHPADPVPEGDVEQVPIWERPIVQNIAKLLAGLVAFILLVLMVVRPLVKGLLQQSREAPRIFAEAESARMQMAQAAGGPPLAYEQQLAQARTMVGQDPKRVAQVVKSWVATDE
jgi:flagellar M-ring protein FliF